LALDPRASRWLLDRRGIRPETAEAFGVHTDGRDLVFRYPEGLIKRRWSRNEDNPFGLEKEGRSFTWNDETGGPAGAGQVPYLPPDFEPGTHMFLFEGETDTMAAWQAAPEEARKGIVGLSGTGSWKKAVVERGGLESMFGKAKVVWVVFDNDDPYKSPDAVASVERAWQEIRGDLGRKAKRVTLPQGINDVAEFFTQYDWEAFRVLLKRALAPVVHYKPLDLSKPAPPVDWLVDGLLVSGEATVLSADSGTGKSWFHMQLCLAVAGDDEDTFLGLPLRKHGNVLVVDEENPEDLVRQRLEALGITPKHWERLQYLNYAGVDLANEPDKLLEQALDLDPVLIVLDSLSRVALGVEENSNTDMSKLFRRGIIPLARETGAHVLTIHHTTKDGGTSPRGAGAIKAAADEAIQMVAAETKKTKERTGRINIFPSKPRRQLQHLTVEIVGDMDAGEQVRMQEVTEDAPF